MIKGKKRTPLTIENVLKLVTEYDLFRYYVPHKWKLNQATNSPLHEDNHPSFLIGNKNGNLTFIDFTTGDKGDVFEFIKVLYSLSSIDEVLRKIDCDMGLGFNSKENVGEYKKIVSQYKQPEEIKEKHYSIIQCVTRKFTKEELSYWNDYYQDIEDLKREHIYSIEKLYLNRKLFPLKSTELRFGYYAPEEGHWKLYRPFSAKKIKWVPNNISSGYMEGKSDIVNCKIAFVNKSRKDRMVVRKVFPCSCSVQNESGGCFTNENVEFLKANSDRQILSFDSDNPGVSNSLQITKLYDFEYCNVPRKYLSEGIKDWAGLSYKYNLELIENILKEKGIL